jgi:hypothetical protein
LQVHPASKLAWVVKIAKVEEVIQISGNMHHVDGSIHQVPV